MKDYFSELGENYINSFVDYLSDNLKDWFLDKLFNYKDVAKKTKEFANKLISVFNKKNDLTNNDDYFSDFKDFDLQKIKSMIKEIFEEQNLFENIKQNAQKELINFQNDNNYNNINILLMGQDYKDVYKFMDIISKIFNIAVEDDNRINLRYKENSGKEININIIIYNINDELNDKINCIWYIISQEIKEIDTKQFSTNNKSNDIPIVYIYFKHKIDHEKYNIISDFNINENIDNCFHLNDSHIIDINNITDEKGKIKEINNKEIEDNFKKYLFNLLEKTLMNILIKDNEFKEDNKSKEVLNIILPRLNFIFGNKINNFYNLNKQIIAAIFRKYIFNNGSLPDSIKKKYRQILKDYQKYLIQKQKISFSEFLDKNGNDFFEDKITNNKKEEESLKKLKKEMISYLKKVNDDNDEENSTNKGEKKKLEEKPKKRMKVNTYCYGDLNEKIKQMFDDYFLNKSSHFINEFIINSIKEANIKYFNLRIMEHYFNFHKGDYILELNDINNENGK